MEEKAKAAAVFNATDKLESDHKTELSALKLKNHTMELDQAKMAGGLGVMAAQSGNGGLANQLGEGEGAANKSMFTALLATQQPPRQFAAPPVVFQPPAIKKKRKRKQRQQQQQLQLLLLRPSAA